MSCPEEVRDFDPTPYLSPEIIEDPDAFLRAPEDMPGPIKIRGIASRKELIKAFERWDKLHHLFICHHKEVNPDDRCELFAVAKDEEKDRQIHHRKRRNLREKHLVGASRELPHAVLPIAPGERQGSCLFGG